MNTRKQDVLTVVGGFATSKKSLEGVTHELVDKYGFSDAQVIPLLDARTHPDEVEDALLKTTVGTLSAGIIPVSRSEHTRGTGERVVAFNPVEARRAGRLVISAMAKSGDLMIRSVSGPDKAGAARVNFDNTKELIRHPVGYGKAVFDIANFSSTHALADIEASGGQVRRIDTGEDKFFGPYELSEYDGKKVVVAGPHDAPLVAPAKFVRELPTELFDFE